MQQTKFVYFNCCILSRYKEEDERLIFGGHNHIKIETVKVIKTNKDYKQFIGALYYLDSMLNGVFMLKPRKINFLFKEFVILFIWNKKKRNI